MFFPKKESHKIHREWEGMPEFSSRSLRKTRRSVTVYFENDEALEQFSKMIGQRITTKMKTVHIPPKQEWAPHEGQQSNKIGWTDES